MRLVATVIAACALLLPASLAAQTNTRQNPSTTTNSVIRPAAMEEWRNYVTVPDGPCGCPMSVQADCYYDCPHHSCLHFVHRVKRMFDCLLPCNICCPRGCLHGCNLGGRNWGHCGVCCGVACDGCNGCGSCGGQGGCCPSPCGSACDCCSPTVGGHCHGCSSALPGLSDPFQDDPLPPKPISSPSSEVRRSPTYRTRPVIVQTPSAVAAAARTPSAYKVVSGPAHASRPAQTRNSQAAVKEAPSANVNGDTRSPSVLRRASVEQEEIISAPRVIEHPRATPLVRSQSPDRIIQVPVPQNPLRN